jgi:hypothetical protein
MPLRLLNLVCLDLRHPPKRLVKLPYLCASSHMAQYRHTFRTFCQIMFTHMAFQLWCAIPSVESAGTADAPMQPFADAPMQPFADAPTQPFADAPTQPFGSAVSLYFVTIHYFIIAGCLTVQKQSGFPFPLVPWRFHMICTEGVYGCFVRPVGTSCMVD